MLNDTLPSLILIRGTIVLLQNFGPCSLAYTIYSLCTLCLGLDGSHGSLWQCVRVYLAVEAVFYLFFLSLYAQYIQREAVHPPLRTQAEREALFTKVYSELHDAERFISGWFKGAKFEDIGYEDMKSFLEWVFWEGRAMVEDDEELRRYIRKIEEMVGKTFKPGRGSAKGLRLTLDPIEITSRPLIWYAVLMLVDTGSFLRLRYYGFIHHRSPFFEPLVFPPRLGLLLPSRRSTSKKLSYWYRPHTSKTRPPVLFIHGIGVGLHPYIRFFHELDRQLNGTQNANSDGAVGIIALELLPICSRITSPILTRSEFLAHVTTVLDAHNIEKFVLCSHSYGSVFSTHILTYKPLASRVVATVLVDPVTILLHMPDVAFNFTVRRPSSASEWQLWYFASKDPGVAHTLGRHFFWYENCLWRDHILALLERGMHITVSLASKDLIVDTAAVAKYLLQDEIPDPVVKTKNGKERVELQVDGQMKDESDSWTTRAWRGQGLDLLWWEGLNHAQVFEHSEPTAKLAGVIAQYCAQG